MLGFFKSRPMENSLKPCRAGRLGFRVASDVKASVHSDGIVLIDHGKGIVFSANRVGALIWSGASEKWSFDRLEQSISSEFHISREAAHEDATEFLAQLAAEGLIVADAR